MAITNSGQLCPTVSVIIPVYNAEKYIGDCLKSILAQTLTNFEVIAVDDCSTDNSRAVVESYVEKFGGRLKLLRMEENSGKPSLPRNKGLIVSRGEYIFFMDNDDVITKTAFEELYELAKTYDADVVYCEKYYSADIALKNVHLKVRNPKIVPVEKPTLEPEFLQERLQRDFRGYFSVLPWLKFLRRDFLMANEIFFPNIFRDDTVWTWEVIFRAKKILRVPNAVYVWREVKSSVTRTEKTPEQEVKFWLNPVILGTKNLDKLLGRFEFFRKNPQYRHAMLNRFIEESFTPMLQATFRLKPFEVYATIKREFGGELGEQDVLISALCTVINTQQKILAVNRQKYDRFAAQAKKRIAELEAQLKSSADNLGAPNA